MVALGHIHAEQGGQGNDTFQGIAARNPRHIAEDADGHFADIGR